MQESNRQRVATLLGQTGLDPEECTRLTTPESLRRGQHILRRQCIQCHDLRTVLARPRTPENWRQTVRRMVERAALMEPLDEEAQWEVTAYLIAISPDLQKSVQQLREQEERRDEAQATAATAEPASPDEYDSRAARQLFESKCTQCHGLDLVEAAPPADATAARDLVSRMVGEGLVVSEDEFSQLVRYLAESHAGSSE
jgi:mono/diheme cytochrome c family protein